MKRVALKSSTAIYLWRNLITFCQSHRDRLANTSKATFPSVLGQPRSGDVSPFFMKGIIIVLLLLQYQAVAGTQYLKKEKALNTLDLSIR